MKTLKEWLGERLERSLTIDQWHYEELLNLYNSL